MLDDTVTHTGCVLIPAALSVAESRNRPGAEILAALALGYEVTARIEAGYGFPGAVMAQGFRHSWPAVFGAATAAALLLGLSADGIADTLALTTTLCVPGTMAWFATWSSPEEAKRIGKWGTSERYVQLAANAKNAVLAASLADTGFHGISEAFEADCGLFSVYTGTSGLPDELLAGLGDEWHLAEVGAKAYPGSQILPLYCAETLLHQNAVNYENVERIEVRSITWKRNIAIIDPGPFTNAEQAHMSSPFGIASMFVFGRFDMEILAQALGDPRVDALAQRIHFEAVQGSSTPGGKFAEMEVWLKDGSCLTADALEMPTERLKPDTWDVMVDRFQKMAPTLTEDKRKQIVQEVWELDQRPNSQALTMLLR
jgi:2-methylcitrate dehydratase PrpD